MVAIQEIITLNSGAWENDPELVEILFCRLSGEYWEDWRIYEYACFCPILVPG
jgi:hypothetical protein